MLNISTFKKQLLLQQLRLIAVVACTQDRAIGWGGNLPWHCPADLKRFKQLTMGKYVIMGRKTMESIGSPLPGRQIIVLSRGKQVSVCGAPVVQDLTTWSAHLTPGQDIIVAGGAQIYEQLLPLCSRVYQTIIEANFLGDRYFPALNPLEWTLVDSEEHAADRRNPHSYRFLTFDRIKI